MTMTSTESERKQKFTVGLSEHFLTKESYAKWIGMSPGEQALWYGWQIWKETNNE